MTKTQLPAFSWLAPAGLGSFIFCPENIWQPTHAEGSVSILHVPWAWMLPGLLPRTPPPSTMLHLPVQPQPATAGPWLSPPWPASNLKQPHLADSTRSYDIMRHQQTFWTLNAHLFGVSPRYQWRILNRDCFPQTFLLLSTNVYRTSFVLIVPVACWRIALNPQKYLLPELTKRT